MSYVTFTRGYADYTIAKNVTNHFKHKPGQTMEVDWSGSAMRLVDPATGEVSKVRLFVAVLPYSQYTYVEATLDMKQNTWLLYLRRRCPMIDQEKGKVATPYESVFSSEEGLLYGKSRKEVFEEFKSETLRLRDGIDLPEDHLSFELLFLGTLCERAATALEKKDYSTAIAYLEKQQRFVTEHILNRIDDLASLAESLLKHPFYNETLTAIKAFAVGCVEQLLAVISIVRNLE